MTNTFKAPEQKSDTFDRRPSLAKTDPTRPAMIISQRPLM